MSLNESLFNAFYSLSHKFILLDFLFVFLAKHLIYIMIAVAIGLIFMEKNFKRRYYFLSLIALCIILGNGIAIPTIHYFYESSRPFVYLTELSPLVVVPETSSMPSGHMMFSVPLSLAVFYMNRRLGLWLLGGVAFMGISRVVSGVHWPLDILVGILLGAAVFYAVKWLLHVRGFKWTEGASAEA